jgi:Flp pilus assembly protein TadG
MKRRISIWYKNSGHRGQAFVELGIMVVIFMMMAFGAIEFGRMISLSNKVAAVARESGRMIYAQNYDTNLMTNVFNIATNMIYPGDLRNHGKMIISYVMRVHGTDTNLTVTNNTNDVLIITNRFYYPYGADITVAASNAPSWTSHLPSTFSNASGKYIPFTNNELPLPVQAGRLYGVVSVVEVFHTNSLLTPVTNIGINVPPYLYEMSLF